MFKSNHSNLHLTWWIPILYSRPAQEVLHLAMFVSLRGALQCLEVYLSQLSIYTLFIRKLLRKIFPTSVPLAALICIGSLNRQSWRWWHQLSWLSFRLVMALVILKCSPICSPVHCVSAFSILYIIFLKNLLKALFQQHQHFVKMYIPFTTVHLFPGFQV